MSYKRIKAKYDGKIAGLYDLEGTIGKGHYAIVKVARHVFTGEKVAVKVIDKTRLDEVSKSHLFQEVRYTYKKRGMGNNRIGPNRTGSE